MEEKHSIKTIFSRRFGEWYEKHERTVAGAAFLGGFILDNLTLSRIDRFFDMFVMFFWLSVAAVSIFAFNLSRQQGKYRSNILLFFMQIAFGALFSGFTVMYMRSGSLAANFPFLALIVFIFVGNEFFRKHYLRITFQTSVLFIAIFFLMIFFLPILLGKMGAWIFLLSGAVSLAAILAFGLVLFAFLPKETEVNRTALIQSIAGIFIVVNIFYFTNSIPPIPLSLKDAGAYHALEKTVKGDYILLGEKGHWFDFFKPHQEIHITSGDPVYFYSAVFAPTRLSTGVAHDWRYYDEKEKKWVPAGIFRFGIFGGREFGYRGYSIKMNVRPGLWRVDVVTGRGQVIGRTKFVVIETETPVVLETVVK